MDTNFFLITKEFTYKNLLLIRRSKRNFYASLVMPAFVCLVIFYIRHLVETTKKLTETQNPNPKKIGQIPKCIKPNDCLSIGYFVIGKSEDWVDSIMRAVAKNNNLEFEKDVRFLANGNSNDFSRYIQENRNKTQIAVIFCTSVWEISYNNFGVSIPCHFERLADKKMVFYSIYYNMTFGFQIPYFFKLNDPYPLNSVAISMKKSVDEAIIQVFTEPSFKLEINTVSFPSTENKFIKDLDIVSNFGSFFFFLPLAVF